ncbi:asparaginase [Buchnera aphidicola]|uniref:asparaginase n=1 Tax=Buchnera aphidicola TaxID=9 RepID=UPI0030EBA787
MKKKKIYIIYTGGTIGMKRSDKGYIPASGYLQKQILKIQKFYRKEVPNFKIKEYFPLIDSSNIRPKLWRKICKDIKKNYIKYDGFIILHGTDTMAYTASALSFALENLQKPVIITGSQIPLCEIRSDGFQNLLNSLLIAANYPINEVTLFFNNKLYRGNRTTKTNSDGLTAFSSPNLSYLLKVSINIKCIKKKYFYNNQKKLIVHKIYNQPINIIFIYPGISHKIIKNIFLKPIKAVILYSYGSGNAPQEKKFLKELIKASNKNIIIINLTQCVFGTVNMKNYATGNSLFKIGVISGYDLTIEAALTKLQFLFSKNISIKKIKKNMQKNLRGELTKS